MGQADTGVAFLGWASGGRQRGVDGGVRGRQVLPNAFHGVDVTQRKGACLCEHAAQVVHLVRNRVKGLNVVPIDRDDRCDHHKPEQLHFVRLGYLGCIINLPHTIHANKLFKDQKIIKVL